MAVAVVWAVLWLPSHVLALCQGVIGFEWTIPHWASVTCSLLGYAHAAIAPLLWLLHQPIRADLVSLLTCRCCKGEDDDDEEYYDSDMEMSETGHLKPALHTDTAVV